MNPVRHILVVDDNPVDAKTIQIITERQGYQTTVIKDSHDVIPFLQKQVVDLVILDWQMPNLSGIEILKTIKSLETLQHLSVVMMSGRNELNHVKQAITGGANDYIIKPIDPLIAKSKIENILHQKFEWAFQSVPEANQARQGSLSQDISVLALSEIGVDISSGFQLAPNTKFLLRIPALTSLGVGEMPVRVCECRPSGPSTWIARCTFIGLREGELKQIRLILQTFKVN